MSLRRAGEARDHRTLLFKLARVVVGVLQHDGVDLCLESMTARLASGGETERLHRHHVCAVQRDKPVRRTNEVHARPAIRELVLHHLGNRHACQRRIERFLQPLRKHDARLDGFEEERLGLAVAAPR